MDAVKGPGRSQSVELPSSTLAGLTVGRRVEDRMRCAGLASGDSCVSEARRLTPPRATNLPLWRKARPEWRELCRTEPYVQPDGSRGTGGRAAQTLAAGERGLGRLMKPNWAERARPAPQLSVRRGLRKLLRMQGLGREEGPRQKSKWRTAK